MMGYLIVEGISQWIPENYCDNNLQIVDKPLIP